MAETEVSSDLSPVNANSVDEASTPSLFEKREGVGRFGSKVWRLAGYRIFGLVLIFVLWQGVAIWIGNPLALPGPVPVFAEIAELVGSGEFFGEAWVTVYRVALGFILAYVLAVIIGLGMGISRKVEATLDSFVLLGLAVPGLAYAIIALIIFGLNQRAAIVGVAAATVSILTLNIWQGTKAVDNDLLEMADSFGISKRETIRWIRLPALTPFLLAACRLGLSISWKLVVIAEMLGTNNGIGYQISFSFNTFSMVGVLAWTLTFTAIIAILEFGLIRPIERRALRWQAGAEDFQAAVAVA